MKQFSELDRDAFEAGFEIARSGNGSPETESQRAGFAFGQRLFASICDGWQPGEQCDERKVKTQLEAVISGKMVILESTAEIKSQLDSAYKELIEGLPPEAAAAIKQRVGSAVFSLNEQLAGSAAIDRKEKHTFDRDAAAFILSQF